MNYQFPQAAYLFFVVILLLWLLWVIYHYHQQTIQKFANADLLNRLLIPRSIVIEVAKGICLILTWTAATFALMQPVSYGHYPQEIANQPKQQGNIYKRKLQRVVLLIDASPSMSVNDMRSRKSRFESAKEVADTLISRLKGEPLALYTFTSELNQISPLTLDYLFVRLMLQQLKISEGEGTNIENALKTLREKHSSESQIILFSDGGDTRIESLRQAENIFAIGFGTKEGQTIPNLTYEGKPVHSSLNETILKGISKHYYVANQYSALDLAAQVINEMQKSAPQISEKEQATAKENLVYDRYFQFPLAMAILFLAMVLLLPNTKVKC